MVDAGRDITVPELGTDPDAATLVRYTIGKSVRRMLRHEDGLRVGRDPEDLHQFLGADPHERAP